MHNKNFKIAYDKEGGVLSVVLGASKSVDSDVSRNVVIDYDKKGNISRVNFYNFDFSKFRGDIRTLRGFARDRRNVSLTVK